MRFIVLAVAVLAVWPSRGNAQDVTPTHQQTTPPSAARFEIVQSPLAARWTFRLDRFSGRVSQLAQGADDNLTWEDMEIIDPPATRGVTRPRFQLFTSGLAVRYTFLLDTETGTTWRATTGMRKSPDGTEYEATVWQPVAK
jgi:hypothetical protein